MRLDAYRNRLASEGSDSAFCCAFIAACLSSLNWGSDLPVATDWWDALSCRLKAAAGAKPQCTKTRRRKTTHTGCMRSVVVVACDFTIIENTKQWAGVLTGSPLQKVSKP